MSSLPPWTVDLADEADTDRLGRVLASSLPERCLITLAGPLGAGKTRLVRAVASACGIDPTEVTSPTFVLCHEYYGSRTIFHLDAYRLSGGEELLAIGFDDYLTEPAWTFLEWPSRVASALPANHLAIELEPVDATRRRVTIRLTDQLDGGASVRAAIESAWSASFSSSPLASGPDGPPRG